MGSAQSYISSEAAITALVLAGAVGLGYKQITSTPTAASPPTPAGTSEEGQGGTQKKGKKKKQGKSTVSGDISETLSASNSQSVPPPRLVAFPEVIPGQFDTSPLLKSTDDLSTPEPASASKPKKPKKKSKGKQTTPVPNADVSQVTSAGAEQASDSSATPSKSKKRQTASQQQSEKRSTPSTSSSQLTRPLQQSTASLDTDGSWTRVGSHRRATDADSSAPSGEVDPTTSDAGITPSVTGNSSPVLERRASTSTEDESFLLNVNTSSRNSGDNRRTLAEKLLPKPRKTGVDELRLFCVFVHINSFRAS